MVLQKIVTEGSGGQEARVGFYWKLTSLLSKTPSLYENKVQKVTSEILKLSFGGLKLNLVGKKGGPIECCSNLE